MDAAEIERADGGKRMMAEHPHHVSRFVRLLSKRGTDASPIVVASLWWEFSMWWVAEWFYPPRSDKEVVYILLRGLRLLPKSDEDWQLPYIELLYETQENCWPMPIRWDVTPSEFDKAAARLLPDHQLDRRRACEVIAQRDFVGSFEACPENDLDLATVRTVASAYFFPVGRVGPDGYPR